ncbi:cytochrome P450 [Paenibacillus beijingensis]|uniref:Cytochrome P450 n=1 Tax=Paenibacillus beijingensis TaxID=1126833 RepID=A0A0D5NNS2_9BACL|nr:cytochrome P450 [Paenibacillus beijingensis]AJY76921.1 cytochrome P450 [Paenibacillus beijingensis]
MENKKYANMLIMPELDSAEKRLFPFDILSVLRKEAPVRYDRTRNCWDVFAYGDVHRVLKDSRTFSSVRGAAAGQNLLFMDPPKHTQLRDLVNKAFTPKAIQELAPRIQSIAEQLLDQVTGEEMDIVSDFATPLPVIVISELLGAPKEDRAHFKRWSDILVESAEDVSDEAFQKITEKRMGAMQELTLYFKSILELRAKQPQDDLISALLKAEINGEKLTERDLIGFCILLLAAGNETTTNLITNGVRIVTEQPSIHSELNLSPETIPSFIEEVLRYYPPIVAIGRIATENTEIGSQTVQAGDQIIIWVGAANWDESKFTDPDKFDLHRKPNPHLSFGFGIHFCLGAPLARLEGKIALQALLDRYNEIKLQTDQPLIPIPSSFVFGVKNYPITFVQ